MSSEFSTSTSIKKYLYSKLELKDNQLKVINTGYRINILFSYNNEIYTMKLESRQISDVTHHELDNIVFQMVDLYSFKRL